MEKPTDGFSVVVLGYVLSEDKKNVLMLYHNGDSNDSSYGKYNGLSGRMRKNESVAEAMRRVVIEEAGVMPDQMVLRGIVHWSNFGHDNQSLLGHIFTISCPSNISLASTSRGELQWVSLERLTTAGELPMWSGDDCILPLVFSEQQKLFYGYMQYEKGVPDFWSYEHLD